MFTIKTEARGAGLLRFLRVYLDPFFVTLNRVSRDAEGCVYVHACVSACACACLCTHRA